MAKNQSSTRLRLLQPAPIQRGRLKRVRVKGEPGVWRVGHLKIYQGGLGQRPKRLRVL